MSANTSDISRPEGASRPGPWARAFSIAWRLVLFTAIWVVVAGTDPSSAIIGAPAVLAATWSSWRLGGRPGNRFSPWGALRFVPYFVNESIRGGLDVAARVLGPRVRVDPGFYDYRLSLSGQGAQVFFVDLVSLLPGTLSADLRGGVVTIHALDHGADIAGDLSQLERRVGALFAEPVATPNAPIRTPEESARA
jgi:multicomponent Na+:H+ antiporter subunit E